MKTKYPKPQSWTKKLHQIKFRLGKVEWVVSLLFIKLNYYICLLEFSIILAICFLPTLQG